jgi:hypothetical protein
MLKTTYGEVRYCLKGKPVCHICGISFDRLLSHVRQKHKISAREYKIKFGLDVIKGICSKESAKKSRKAVFDNYELVVKQNLIKNGKNTTFKKGSKGRTRDQVSAQTKTRLTKRFEQFHIKKKDK